MKKIFKFIIILAITMVSFFWLLVLASSHNVPIKSHLILMIIILCLSLFLLILKNEK
jgi:hypothetical protein